jgi:hypothetical protein
MKTLSLALFLTACTVAGVAQAQDRPPSDTVRRITDPDAVARSEQNARDAAASAQRAEDMQMHKAPMHHGQKMHKPMMKRDARPSEKQ